MKHILEYRRLLLLLIIALILIPSVCSFADTTQYQYDDTRHVVHVQKWGGTATITATATGNGSISPSGTTAVSNGGSQTYTITPASGSFIESVQVDGVSVGAVSSYTFSNVTADHSIAVQFMSNIMLKSGPTPQYFTTLQDAYNAANAAAGGIIKVQAGTLTQNLTVSGIQIITLQGGCSQDFSSCTGTTTLIGSLTTSPGAVPLSLGGFTISSSQSAPATLHQMTLNQNSVTGGNPAQGTVTLNAAAPGGGAVVTLTSTNTATSAVSTIGTVIVPAGSTSVPFTMNTTAVGSDTSWLISANYGGTTLSSLLTVQPSTPEGTFTDVATNYWAFDYIEAIYQAGITQGCSQPPYPVMYCPADSVTRGQAAAFIIRPLYGNNFSINSQTPYFCDVPTSHPFFTYIQKMKDMAITVGCGACTVGNCSGTCYCPDTAVTREQVATFIIRALQVQAGQPTESFTYTQTPYFTDEQPTYSDGSTNPYFKYVQKLKDDGLTTMVGYFNGTQITPRDQMAAFLARAFIPNFTSSITSTFSAVLSSYVASACLEALPPSTTSAPPWSTPGTYLWKVPDGVSSITVDVWGAEGSPGAPAGYDGTAGGLGGYGGRVQATVAVTPGQILVIQVGGESNNQSGGYNSGGAGGNGGGNGGGYGGGGGGYSIISVQGGSTLVIAGGGGGGGGSYANTLPGGTGGDGGQVGIQGSSAVSGYMGTGGSGGTQSAAGVGGVSSPNPGDGSGLGGSGSTGGSGGALSGSGDYGAGGGGGGGGYYSGGGGSANGTAGNGGAGAGGGGGASWANTSYATGVTYTAGYNSGSGYVNIVTSSVSASSVYTVTPSAGTGGSISPATAQTVNSGSTVSFTVTANTGYNISSVTGCGGTLSGNTYTTGAITGNCTVSATFAASSGGTGGSGGTVVSSVSQAISTGTAQVGYEASKAFDNNSSTGCSLYGSGDVSVGQNFGTAINISTLGVQRNGVGDVVWTGKLQYSDNNTIWSDTNVTTISVASNNGTGFVTYPVNDYGAHQYWRILLTSGGYLQATEIQMTQRSGLSAASVYTVTPSAGAGGSISPATAQTVNSGSTVSLTITPNTGYSISSVTGCSGTLSGSTYTTGAITGNCTVTATFTASPVNGSCGTSNGQTLTAAPSSNLCSTGTASTVSGSGPWTWSCTGSNGGTTASCSASMQTATTTSGSQTYTAGQSGTFTVPSGVTQITVSMWGGGAGGYTGSSGSWNGDGGGGAGAIVGYKLAVTSGQTINYSVGAGGLGGPSQNSLGTAGGTTSFGTLIAYGGQPGAQYGGTGGSGGSATDGTYTASGGAGGTTSANGGNGQQVSAGGGMLYGGGGGGAPFAYSACASGLGGSSYSNTTACGGYGGGGGSSYGSGGSGYENSTQADSGVNGGGGAGLWAAAGYVAGKGGDGQIIVSW